MNKFKELNLNSNLLKAIEEANFSEPTEIQLKTIPLVLSGKDVIARSATGSGKTLAFGAGIIEKIVPGKGVQALVITPTRELAEQNARVLKKFSKYFNLNIAEVYGGVSINPQIEKIKKSEIVAGTPGRIIDHLKQRTLNLQNLKALVLDEADRMLDMGFIEDIRTIIDFCPEDRQTLLFSATISPDIENIGRRYMRDPVFVSAESYIDPKKLQQFFYDVPQNLKFSLLVHLLKQEKTGLVMVFCKTRANAELLAKNLKNYGLEVVSIHGGLSQNKRNQVMGHFHSGKAKILVCTDVAARGLDIKGVTHIYNYDIPSNSTEYIHRIGRTARAGKEGKAISLVSKKDYENFRKVMEDDELKIVALSLPEIEHLKISFKRLKKNLQRDPRKGFSNIRKYRRREGSKRDRNFYDSGKTRKRFW